MPAITGRPCNRCKSRSTWGPATSFNACHRWQAMQSGKPDGKRCRVCTFNACHRWQAMQCADPQKASLLRRDLSTPAIAGRPCNSTLTMWSCHISSFQRLPSLAGHAIKQQISTVRGIPILSTPAIAGRPCNQLHATTRKGLRGLSTPAIAGRPCNASSLRSTSPRSTLSTPAIAGRPCNSGSSRCPCMTHRSFNACHRWQAMQ